MSKAEIGLAPQTLRKNALKVPDAQPDEIQPDEYQTGEFQSDESQPVGGRLLAVGDIHGCWKPLEAILDSVRPTPEDTLVILGDFTNRGPDSCRVVAELIKLQPATRLITILGNHEEELLLAFQNASSLSRWLAMGGDKTLDSYGASSIEELPAEHVRFIEAALPWWECDDFFFTHANYIADQPLSEQGSTELRWTALGELPIKPHCSGKTAIVGHTPNLQGRVVDFGFLRCLDTGCGLGGCLTMMDVRTGHVWQCGQDSCKVVWH